MWLVKGKSFIIYTYNNNLNFFTWNDKKKWIKFKLNFNLQISDLQWKQYEITAVTWIIQYVLNKC